MDKRERDYSIDFVKGVAILFVILLHNMPNESIYSEAVLISFDKSVKHDLDECNLYHSFCGFSKEFVIDGQPSEVFQP